ncbi:hypothetical protein DFJ69_2311 [Thermomonospora umbrina]|uniref:Phospholipase D-like protein n=1 Tax=Thermomonospora umbrina TaxID=111806 RepID=A0A3D9SLY0_9ACTN|nr:hypothetical protein DFJ69_2311 [Thermomonospora umbrina]
MRPPGQTPSPEARPSRDTGGRQTPRTTSSTEPEGANAPQTETPTISGLAHHRRQRPRELEHGTAKTPAVTGPPHHRRRKIRDQKQASAQTPTADRARIRPAAQTTERERPPAVVPAVSGDGLPVAARESMHEKVLILDAAVLWHDSLNLLAHRGATDLMMRSPIRRPANGFRTSSSAPEWTGRSGSGGPRPRRLGRSVEEVGGAPGVASTSTFRTTRRRGRAAGEGTMGPRSEGPGTSRPTPRGCLTAGGRVRGGRGSRRGEW